jgi:hypothetical protein
MIPNARFILRLLVLLSLIVGSSWPLISSGLPENTNPVTLEQLYAGHFVRIKERFAVSRVQIAGKDVTELFVLQARRPTAWAPSRLTYAKIKIRNQQSLLKLQTLLTQQKDPRLVLIIEDDGWIATIYRGLPQFIQISKKFKDTIHVPVDLTPCEEITAIIYKNIDAVLKRVIERAGQTGEPVTLDYVFELLVKEKINPFMARMERLRPLEAQHKCFATFSLLNWLRKKEAKGFEFAGYRITDDLKEILGRVGSSLRETQGWQRHQFRIYVIGYTDDIRFGKDDYGGGRELQLLAGRAGIRSLSDPLRIWYAGCSGDVLNNKDPVDIPFGSTGQREVGDLVSDNCELGAVRAYVALAFLRQVMGTDAVEYLYATGGISPTAPKGVEDAATRKAEIRFRVMAARKVKGLLTTATTQ